MKAGAQFFRGLNCGNALAAERVQFVGYSGTYWPLSLMLLIVIRSLSQGLLLPLLFLLRSYDHALDPESGFPLMKFAVVIRFFSGARQLASQRFCPDCPVLKSCFCVQGPGL